LPQKFAMINLACIWMLSSLVASNRQSIVESQISHHYKNVTLNIYSLEGDKVLMQERTYDSACVRTTDAGMLKSYYYLGNHVDSTAIDLTSYDTSSYKNRDTALMPDMHGLNYKRCDVTAVDNINLPFYVSSWWSCPDDMCSTKHGHIQFGSKSWYSSEFGALIIASGNYGNPAYVSVLMGIEGRPLASKLVNELMLEFFKKEPLLLEKYQDDLTAS